MHVWLCDFSEAFYKPHRRHSLIGHESPIDFEKKHASAA